MKTIDDSWKLQLRKGLFEILILSFLDKKPMYGYEINHALNSIPEFQIPNGTIYPILQRLTKNEWAVFYWEESDSGPRRKYYKITEGGREVLKDRVEYYGSIHKILSQQINEESLNDKK